MVGWIYNSGMSMITNFDIEQFLNSVKRLSKQRKQEVDIPQLQHFYKYNQKWGELI